MRNLCSPNFTSLLEIDSAAEPDLSSWYGKLFSHFIDPKPVQNLVHYLANAYHASAHLIMMRIVEIKLEM